MTAARRVLVVGCPRSGTTLLQCMLGAHSRTITFRESHALGELFANRRLLRLVGLASRANVARMDRFLREVGAVPPRALRYPISARKSVRLFCACLDDLTAQRGGCCWIEKTPSHIYSMPWLERWEPTLRFVHIVRDGADTIASHYEATRRYPDEFGGRLTVERAVALWREAILLSQRRVGQPRHSIVHYSQLVTEPDRCLQRICADLGLGYEPSMRHAYQEQLEQIGASGEPWKQNIRKPLGLAPSNTFESVFDADQRSYVLEQIRDVELPASAEG